MFWFLSHGRWTVVAEAGSSQYEGHSLIAVEQHVKCVNNWSNLRQVPNWSCVSGAQHDESRPVILLHHESPGLRIKCSRHTALSPPLILLWVLAASSGNTRAQAPVLTWKSVCIALKMNWGFCAQNAQPAASQSQRSLLLQFYSWKKKP